MGTGRRGSGEGSRWVRERAEVEGRVRVFELKVRVNLRFCLGLVMGLGSFKGTLR